MTTKRRTNSAAKRKHDAIMNQNSPPTANDPVYVHQAVLSTGPVPTREERYEHANMVSRTCYKYKVFETNIHKNYTDIKVELMELGCAQTAHNFKAATENPSTRAVFDSYQRHYMVCILF
jgi:hypothetical protein